MKDNFQKLVIYTDGGARDNPGPAAIGVVIRDGEGKTLKKYSEFIGRRTNNEAEYEAVIFALKKAKQLFGKDSTKKMNVELYTDSELITKQLNGEYKIEDEKLCPLFLKIWNLKIDFGSISFQSVPRNKNKEADRLVNQALDAKKQAKIF